MSYKTVDNIVIENARIIFRNFRGEEGKFNRAGSRNFCVVIEDPAQVEMLVEDGWNVKELQPRNEDETVRYFLKVSVNYDGPFPPKCYLVRSNGTKIFLNENSIGELDYAEIKNIDISIRPYNWEVSGKEGIKAYLHTMYVTLEEDPFASKYAEEESPEDDENVLPFC